MLIRHWWKLVGGPAASSLTFPIALPYCFPLASGPPPYQGIHSQPDSLTVLTSLAYLPLQTWEHRSSTAKTHWTATESQVRTNSMAHATDVTGFSIQLQFQSITRPVIAIFKSPLHNYVFFLENFDKFS